MQYQFIDVDVEKTTFQRASTHRQRMGSLLATIAIGIGIAAGVAIGLPIVDMHIDVELMGVLISVITLIEYIVKGRFLPADAARRLVSVTPMGVLYRHDMKVLEQGREELLRIAGSVQFDAFSSYAKVNPSLRSSAVKAVIQHQRRGDLAEWCHHPHNLKSLADMVFQLHLVERLLLEDMKDAASCALVSNNRG